MQQCRPFAKVLPGQQGGIEIIVTKVRSMDSCFPFDTLALSREKTYEERFRIFVLDNTKYPLQNFTPEKEISRWPALKPLIPK